MALRYAFFVLVLIMPQAQASSEFTYSLPVICEKEDYGREPDRAGGISPQKSANNLVVQAIVACDFEKVEEYLDGFVPVVHASVKDMHLTKKFVDPVTKESGSLLDIAMNNTSLENLASCSSAKKSIPALLIAKRIDLDGKFAGLYWSTLYEKRRADAEEKLQHVHARLRVVYDSEFGHGSYDAMMHSDSIAAKKEEREIMKSCLADEDSGRLIA